MADRHPSGPRKTILLCISHVIDVPAEAFKLADGICTAGYDVKIVHLDFESHQDSSFQITDLVRSTAGFMTFSLVDRPDQVRPAVECVRAIKIDAPELHTVAFGRAAALVKTERLGRFRLFDSVEVGGVFSGDSGEEPEISALLKFLTQKVTTSLVFPRPELLHNRDKLMRLAPKGLLAGPIFRSTGFEYLLSVETDLGMCADSFEKFFRHVEASGYHSVCLEVGASARSLTQALQHLKSRCCVFHLDACFGFRNPPENAFLDVAVSLFRAVHLEFEPNPEWIDSCNGDPAVLVEKYLAQAPVSTFFTLRVDYSHWGSDFAWWRQRRASVHGLMRNVRFSRVKYGSVRPCRPVADSRGQASATERHATSFPLCTGPSSSCIGFRHDCSLHSDPFCWIVETAAHVQEALWERRSLLLVCVSDLIGAEACETLIDEAVGRFACFSRFGDLPSFPDLSAVVGTIIASFCIGLVDRLDQLHPALAAYAKEVAARERFRSSRLAHLSGWLGAETEGGESHFVNHTAFPLAAPTVRFWANVLLPAEVCPAAGLNAFEPSNQCDLYPEPIPLLFALGCDNERETTVVANNEVLRAMELADGKTSIHEIGDRLRSEGCVCPEELLEILITYEFIVL